MLPPVPPHLLIYSFRSVPKLSILQRPLLFDMNQFQIDPDSVYFFSVQHLGRQTDRQGQGQGQGDREAGRHRGSEQTTSGRKDRLSDGPTICLDGGQTNGTTQRVFKFMPHSQLQTTPHAGIPWPAQLAR